MTKIGDLGENDRKEFGGTEDEQKGRELNVEETNNLQAAKPLLEMSQKRRIAVTAGVMVGMFIATLERPYRWYGDANGHRIIGRAKSL